MNAHSAAEYVLTNARVVLSDQELLGTVLVRDGKIAAISEDQ